MPENPSLAEYLGQAHRTNNFLGVFGPDFLQKQTFLGTDTSNASISGDIFTTTFGRKVWHALNNQTRFFNAIPKVVWGNTAGWRVRTDRGSGRSRPISEVGALPTIDVSNIATVSSLPRIVGTTFGVTVRAAFVAQLEGGAGDIMGMEMENAQIDHVKEINQELLAGSAFPVSAGTTTTAVMPASIASHFKVGDTVAVYDVSGTAHAQGTTQTVSSVSGGTVTVSAAWGSSVNVDVNDTVYIVNRAGISSIADVVMQDDVAIGTDGSNNALASVDVYDQSSRAAGAWNAGARVDYNAGTGRDLTLNLIDNVIRDIRINGGEPKIIVMGHDQYYRLERLLQTQQRYLGYEEYQVGVGSERTFPGTRAGMMLATYQGIPILPEVDTPHSVTANGATVLGSDIFVLDTDYLEMAVAQPTQYIENRDYFAANQLVVRGLFYTLGELRCRNIWVQGKLSHLNA